MLAQVDKDIHFALVTNWKQPKCPSEGSGAINHSLWMQWHVIQLSERIRKIWMSGYGKLSKTHCQVTKKANQRNIHIAWSCVCFKKYYVSIYTYMHVYKKQDSGQVHTKQLIAVTSVGRNWGRRKRGTFLYPNSSSIVCMHSCNWLNLKNKQRRTMERC